MDRVSRLRAEAGSTSDVSGGNDTGFQTADDTSAGSTNYLSFSDDDSCTPKKSKNDALGESTPRPTAADADFAAGLSPIAPTDDDGYSMGGQIDARNILSGGVDIFDDYNSNDGDGLVIDDEANVSEDAESGADDRMSRCTEKVICEPIESANLSLSADATLTLKEISESQLVEVGGDGEAREVKSEEVLNNEVILQIDGKDVDALDIGNGLYLYRKGEGEELNALQILQEEGQQPHFKFLKVRQIADSNLEVYEEHITEVPMTNEELEEEKRKERINQEILELHQKTPHLPITDFKKALKENPTSGKTVTLSAKANTKDDNSMKLEASVDLKSKTSIDKKSDIHSDSKLKPLKNLEGSRKSPILGNITSMTLHSSANREGALPTKTMINLPLNSNRNSDTVKKTIEVSTDNSNLKNNEKTTIANVFPPKVDIYTGVSPNLLGDTKKDAVICKSSVMQEKSISDVKVKADKFISENELDNKIKQFENEEKLELSVKSKDEIVNNNASILSKNNLDNKTDTEIESIEIKKITDKLSLTNKQLDMKKEIQSNKTTNVISKWVLRSDSIEEKCKKEKEKIPVEVKVNTNSFSNKIHSSDISVKNSHKDVEIKHKKMESLNVNIPQASPRDKGMEMKDKLHKPSSETTGPLDKVTKCILGESSKTAPKSMFTETKPQKVHNDHKYVNTHTVKETISGKNDLVRGDKDVKNEKANNFEFVNKYISEAFKNVPTRPITIPPSNISTNKLGIDNKPKIKPLEKVHATSVKTTGYDSPLRIDVETPTKPVPFGKWTEGDKQEYLNKLKDQKQPSTNSSLSPVKNYQLASAKNDMKRLELKKKADTFERAHLSNVSLPALPEDKDKETSNDVHMKGLIDKTIEGMIVGSAVKPPTINPPKITSADTTDKDTNSFDDVERRMNELHGMIHPKEKLNLSLPSSVRGAIGSVVSNSKVSEKPFTKIETDPSHSKSFTKGNLIPKLLPLNYNSCNKVETKLPQEIASVSKSNDDEDSEEEIIDSQPVTGDMQWLTQQTRDSQKVTIAAIQKMVEADRVNANTSARQLQDKKSGITEVEFDKFVRRNSTNQTIPNCTISEVKDTTVQASGERVLDSDNKNKQTKLSNPHTLEKPIPSSMCVSKPQQVLGAVRSHIPQAIHPIKPVAKESGDASTLYHAQENATTLNYHTKIQMAYQSAISAKNQKEPPAKNFDEKSKTTFVSSNTDIISTAKTIPSVKRSSNNDSSICTLSDTVSSVVDVKVNDQIPVKTKHQRKQVLTSVETPPIEIIEPLDHADNGAHKKRRKTDNKLQRNETESHKNPSKDFKNKSPKKNYLLGRITPVTEETKKEAKDKVVETNEDISNKNATGNLEEPIVEIETPKRGRGRPRKNPTQNTLESPKNIQEPYTSKSSESDSQDKNSGTVSADTEYEDSEEEGIIRENWTLSKIDDKIVCPICHKLFRSESIVFKHVKHCSNLLKSPKKRTSSAATETSSPKKGRLETISTEVSGNEEGKKQSTDAEPTIAVEESKKGLNVQTPNKIKSDKIQDLIVLDTPSPNEVIVLEDSPLITLDKPLKEREGSEKFKENKPVDVKKSESIVTQPQVKKVGRPRSTTQHTCEICGKTFRQLSYLIHHRTLHSKEPPKHRPNDNSVSEKKPILSCDTCGKDFRKLHHLVEHREIHNMNMTPQRKNSIDRTEQKKDTEPSTSKIAPKKVDDHPAGFRCEPCDKSFRKLHHLVEHRETHDGVNRLKNSPPQLSQVEKPPTESSPTCEICGKSFRKLHHLIEHRETHNESQTEKKERKSSLLARDIIHECSLCYMVFPNEPSLNKHFVNCQKKKKAPMMKTSTADDSKAEVQIATLDVQAENSEPKDPESKSTSTELIPPVLPSPPLALATVAIKRNPNEILHDTTQDIPEKIQKLESEAPKTPKNPKPLRGGETVTKVTKFGATVTKPAKVGATVTKRSRSSLALLPENETIEIKFKDSDDEVRYMINPSYRPDSDEEKEIFMNICVTKRSSLQFDTPSAKAEFKRRRISLQHPPKSQRAGSKKVEKLSKPPNVPADREVEAPKAKLIKNKQSSSTVPSNSLLAEDNEVKYSFPKTAKTRKSGIPTPKIQTNKVTIEDRTRKADKRKSLTGIAKRKSMGKGATVKLTHKDLPRTIVPKKDIKTMLQHVCDCGAPFSSVTLLAQHTSVAHTPPRIRRARVLDQSARIKQVKVTKHSGVPVAFKPLRDTDK